MVTEVGSLITREDDSIETISAVGFGDSYAGKEILEPMIADDESRS